MGLRVRWMKGLREGSGTMPGCLPPQALNGVCASSSGFFMGMGVYFVAGNGWMFIVSTLNASPSLICQGLL